MGKPPRDLIRKWYDKARASGLDDIEIPTTSGNMDGRMRTSVRIDQGSPLVRQGPETAEYYRRAAIFLHEHRFATTQERSIWELHAAGVSYHDIEERLGLTNWRVESTLSALIPVMEAKYTTKRRGRPRGPTGRESFKRRVRFTDDQADAIHFIATQEQLSLLGAIRLAVLMYAKALQLGGAPNCQTNVPKKEGE